MQGGARHFRRGEKAPLRDVRAARGGGWGGSRVQKTGAATRPIRQGRKVQRHSRHAEGGEGGRRGIRRKGEAWCRGEEGVQQTPASTRHVRGAPGIRRPFPPKANRTKPEREGLAPPSRPTHGAALLSPRVGERRHRRFRGTERNERQVRCPAPSQSHAAAQRRGRRSSEGGGATDPPAPPSLCTHRLEGARTVGQAINRAVRARVRACAPPGAFGCTVGGARASRGG